MPYFECSARKQVTLLFRWWRCATFFVARGWSCRISYQVLCSIVVEWSPINMATLTNSSAALLQSGFLSIRQPLINTAGPGSPQILLIYEKGCLWNEMSPSKYVYPYKSRDDDFLQQKPLAFTSCAPTHQAITFRRMMSLSRRMMDLSTHRLRAGRSVPPCHLGIFCPPSLYARNAWIGKSRAGGARKGRPTAWLLLRHEAQLQAELGAVHF